MSTKVNKTDFEYNSQLDAFELYHLVLEDSKRPSHRNGGPVLPALGHALAGSVATAASKLLIYPLDLVIARLQVQKQLRSRSGARNADAEYKGLVDAAAKIYQHEGGIGAFYTGCLTDVTKGIADSFLFFLAYSFLQQRELRKLPPNSKKQLSIGKEMGIGIAAGAFSRLITTPLQNIITRQQTAALAVAGSRESDDGLRKGDKLTIADIARQIHKERGLAGFWTGYNLSLILTLNPAITFTVDNFLQKVLRARDASSHVTFLIAAMSKSIATAITYPVSVAKSRAQAKPSDQASDVKDAAKSANRQRQRTVFSRLLQLFAAQYAVVVSIRNIYRQDGVSGLYSGIEAEVLKGFLSHGLTMAMKDRIHGGIIELYYLLLKLTKNWPAEASELVSNAKERVENAGASAVQAGKDIASGAAERAENVGTTVSEAGKNFATGASQRADNVASEASKRGENIGSSAWEAGKNVATGASQRAEHFGAKVAEGSKNIVTGASERADNIAVTAGEATRNATDGVVDRTQSFGSETIAAAKDTAADLKQRADNISVTTFEAGKSIAAAAKDRVGDIRDNAIEAGKTIAAGARERAGNVGVTVVEAGKHVVRELKK